MLLALAPVLLLVQDGTCREASPLRCHLERVDRGIAHVVSLTEHLAPPRHRSRVTLETRGAQLAHTARPDVLHDFERRSIVDVFDAGSSWQLERLDEGDDAVRVFKKGLATDGHRMTAAELLRRNLLVRAAFPQTLVAFVADTGRIVDFIDGGAGDRSVVVDLVGGTVVLRTVDLEYGDQTVPGLVGVEWVTHDPVLGDFTESLEFEFAAAPGPGVVEGWRLEGDLGTWEETRVVEFESDGMGAAAYQPKLHTSSPVERVQVDVAPLAPGVFEVHVPEHDARVLALESEDGWIVLEAPKSSRVGEAILSALDDERPGLGVAYVAPSHHHPACVGGLRAFAAAGATIVCADAVAPYLDHLMRRPRTIEPDRLSRSNVEPRFVTIDFGDRWTPPGMEDRLVAVEAGGLSPHTEAHVTFYLPNARMAFGGDLLWVPVDEDRPVTSPRTLALLAMLRSSGYEVDEYLAGWPVVRGAEKKKQWKDRVALRDLRVSDRR